MFLVVALLAGLVQSWWALLGVPAAVLIGFAFAAIGMFATTYMRPGSHFDYITLAIQPMFLFSATFFPLVDLPRRAAVAGAADPALQRRGPRAGADARRGRRGCCWHVAYLAALGGLGLVGTARRLEKLLLS